MANEPAAELLAECRRVIEPLLQRPSTELKEAQFRLWNEEQDKAQSYLENDTAPPAEILQAIEIHHWACKAFDAADLIERAFSRLSLMAALSAAPEGVRLECDGISGDPPCGACNGTGRSPASPVAASDGDAVERVAEAIWQAESKRSLGRARLVSWADGIDGGDKERYRFVARAALSAAGRTSEAEIVERCAKIADAQADFHNKRAHSSPDADAIWAHEGAETSCRKVAAAIRASLRQGEQEHPNG